MFQVMGVTGMARDGATKVVNAIDSAGYAILVAGVIMSFVSAGTLAAAGLSLDAFVLAVRAYLARSMRAQAIVY